MNISFHDEQLSPVFNFYAENNTLRIDFITEIGEPYITLSTNLGIGYMDFNEVFVKQTDSHKDLADLLVDNGCLEKQELVQQAGYCTYRLYKIKGHLLDKLNTFMVDKFENN